MPSQRVVNLYNNTLHGDVYLQDTRQQPLRSIKLQWRPEKKAPKRMDRPCDAVVIGSTVYFRAGGTTEMYTYDCSRDEWSPLPTSPPTKSCALAVVNNLLTAIGGRPEANDFCCCANNIIPFLSYLLFSKNLVNLNLRPLDLRYFILNSST